VVRKMDLYRGKDPDWEKNVIFIKDAIISEIQLEEGMSAYVTIAHPVIDDAGAVIYNYVKLIVSEETLIQDVFQDILTVQDLEVGMNVSAVISAAMTRSIPPQSNAYIITVKNDAEDTAVTIDRVAEVDLDNGFLYTGNPYDINDQIRFVIMDTTVLMDTEGNLIYFDELSQGQKVRVEHATFMTASIPPQTTAFLVVLYN
jgi:hypothetical protein